MCIPACNWAGGGETRRCTPPDSSPHYGQQAGGRQFWPLNVEEIRDQCLRLSYDFKSCMGEWCIFKNLSCSQKYNLRH